MAKPKFMSDADWELVKSICLDYGVSPYLIAAIGWHETHWGRLGAGKIGWILGYGYFPGSKVKEKYKGLENQLHGACHQISRDLKLPLTLNTLIDFAVNSWKSAAPTSWAKSVWSIYTAIKKDYTIPETDTEIQDLTERVEVLEHSVSLFKELVKRLAKEFGNER